MKNNATSYVKIQRIMLPFFLLDKEQNSKAPSQCLKITEKVPFNIASEASYFYILTGQKLIKKAKNGPFWRVFDNLKLKV